MFYYRIFNRFFNKKDGPALVQHSWGCVILALGIGLLPRVLSEAQDKGKLLEKVGPLPFQI